MAQLVKVGPRRYELEQEPVRLSILPYDTSRACVYVIMSGGIADAQLSTILYYTNIKAFVCDITQVSFPRKHF